MKVFAKVDDEQRLIGHADIPEDVGAVYKVPLFGPNETIFMSFAIRDVTTHFATKDGEPIFFRAVVLAEGQSPELLPGWKLLVPQISFAGEKIFPKGYVDPAGGAAGRDDDEGTLPLHSDGAASGSA